MDGFESQGAAAHAPRPSFLVIQHAPLMHSTFIDTMDFSYRALEENILISPGYLFTRKRTYYNCMRIHAGEWGRISGVPSRGWRRCSSSPRPTIVDRFCMKTLSCWLSIPRRSGCWHTSFSADGSKAAVKGKTISAEGVQESLGGRVGGDSPHCFEKITRCRFESSVFLPRRRSGRRGWLRAPRGPPA